MTPSSSFWGTCSSSSEFWIFSGFSSLLHVPKNPPKGGSKRHHDQMCQLTPLDTKEQWLYFKLPQTTECLILSLLILVSWPFATVGTRWSFVDFFYSAYSSPQHAVKQSLHNCRISFNLYVHDLLHYSRTRHFQNSFTLGRDQTPIQIEQSTVCVQLRIWNYFCPVLSHWPSVNDVEAINQWFSNLILSPQSPSCIRFRLFVLQCIWFKLPPLAYHLMLENNIWSVISLFKMWQQVKTKRYRSVDHEDLDF